MKYRPLGNSGLEVPVVSFGAWAAGGWMWGGADDAETVRALQHAIDLGITCIDTAPAYGMGHSERIVARAIAGRRDQVILATKCGLRWDIEEGQHFFDTIDNDGQPLRIFRNLRPESIRQECEQSLLRLETEVIDLYQCHWPDPTTPIEDTMGELSRLREEGKIRAVGVSNFSNDMIDTSMKIVPIVSSQPKYNALEREAEKEHLRYCVEKKIGVLAYSPIAQGLLTGKVGLDRVFPEGDVRRNKPLFSMENRAKVLDMLEKTRPIAETYGLTFGQLFIAWLIAQPGLTSALVGARSEAQVEENARAGEIELSPEDIALIRTMLESLGELAAPVK